MSGGRITYADALNSLHQMFPDTRMAVIESILAQNGGAMEPTVEQILSLDSAASLAPAAVLPPARQPQRPVGVGIPVGSATAGHAPMHASSHSHHRTARRWRHPLPDTFLRVPGVIPPRGALLDEPPHSSATASSSSAAPASSASQLDADGQLAAMLQNEMFQEALSNDPEFAEYLRQNPEVAQSLGLRMPLPARQQPRTHVIQSGGGGGQRASGSRPPASQQPSQSLPYSSMAGDGSVPPVALNPLAQHGASRRVDTSSFGSGAQGSASTSDSAARGATGRGGVSANDGQPPMFDGLSKAVSSMGSDMKRRLDTLAARFRRNQQSGFATSSSSASSGSSSGGAGSGSGVSSWFSVPAVSRGPGYSSVPQHGQDDVSFGSLGSSSGASSSRYTDAPPEPLGGGDASAASAKGSASRPPISAGVIDWEPLTQTDSGSSTGFTPPPAQAPHHQKPQFSGSGPSSRQIELASIASAAAAGSSSSSSGVGGAAGASASSSSRAVNTLNPLGAHAGAGHPGLAPAFAIDDEEEDHGKSLLSSHI